MSCVSLSFSIWNEAHNGASAFPSLVQTSPETDVTQGLYLEVQGVFQDHGDAGCSQWDYGGHFMDSVSKRLQDRGWCFSSNERCL